MESTFSTAFSSKLKSIETLTVVFFFFSGGTDNVMTSPKTWDKPWAPEIDWLDPYYNLSTVSQEIIDGIILGSKFTKYISNVSSPSYEWVAAVKINHDLADSYYNKHYMNTNRTMFICAPELGGRMDILLDYYTVEWLAYCVNYQLGIYRNRGDWSFVWSTFGGVPLKVAMSAVVLIAITGLLGEFLLFLLQNIHETDVKCITSYCGKLRPPN